MRKLRAFFKHKTKKQKIMLAAGGLVLVLLLIFGVRQIFFRKKVEQPGSQTRTLLLAKQDLTESVTVNGTVKSTAVTNVTSNSAYKVAEILVKEGETVAEGDVLCRLDTTEIDKEIAKKKTAMAETLADATAERDKAATARDEAYNKATDAEPAAHSAEAVYRGLETKYVVAKKSIDTAQGAYDAALSADQQAGAAMNDALTAANGDVNAAGYLSAVARKNETQAALAVADAALKTAKNNAGYDALAQEYNAAKAEYERTRSTLVTLQDAYKRALDSLSMAEDKLSSAKKDDTLDTLLEKLEECVITAPGSGTITQVGATVGSPASGGAVAGGAPIFVIQNTDDLKVAITIDEYDIQSIKTGMTATILSDATGEKEINGTVSQISQTATATQDAAGFGAEITVNDKNSGLLIGTSAKVNIVLSGKKDVFAVPFDAVGKDEKGNSVIYVKKEKEFEPMIITTGLETDYYVEIEGALLAEGLEIRASADNSSIVDNTMQAMMQGGPMQAMPPQDVEVTVGERSTGGKGGRA